MADINNETATGTTTLVALPKKRILVTGGAGFLGVNLCKRLLEHGHEVICLDNFFTSQRCNIVPLLSHPNFEFIRHDVTDPYQFEVDEIYNLACPASPPHYQFNPIKTTKTSVLGIIHALELAKAKGAKLFQASTSEVYGDPTVTPQPEGYWGNVNCIGIRSCYDEGKRVAETFCFDYWRTERVDVRVGRIFNTYGPGMHPYDGRVISNFILQSLAHENVTIYGDGSQTRAFCFVQDLIDGIVGFMDSTYGPGPMNLGNPNELTIREVAERIIALTESSSKIVYLPLPSNDPKRRNPDITVAKKQLGWEPQVAFETGLKLTIAYFKSLDLSQYRRPTPQTAHTSTQREHLAM